jgi:hypothetical protein
MTVDLDDTQDDSVLAALARLRTCDISARRARQLRRRCHVVLKADPRPERLAWRMDGTPLRRIIVPTLGGAWCLAYLVEIIRCTAAIYRYFGTQ